MQLRIQMKGKTLLAKLMSIIKAQHFVACSPQLVSFLRQFKSESDPVPQTTPSSTAQVPVLMLWTW